jgi:hypothetical protein
LKVYVGNPVVVILCFGETLVVRVIIVFVTDGDLERVAEYVIGDALVLGELLPE